jgi:hypothetical protein
MTPTSVLAQIMDAFILPLVSIVVYVLTNYWGYLLVFAIAGGIAAYLLSKGRQIAGGK